jgi:hypothetical protein
MSKATFYRIPMKTTKTYAPRRRRRLVVTEDALRTPGSRVGDVAERRPAYHPAPQFRRNRRFWLRRFALAKAPEPK